MSGGLEALPPAGSRGRAPGLSMGQAQRKLALVTLSVIESNVDRLLVDAARRFVTDGLSYIASVNTLHSAAEHLLNLDAVSPQYAARLPIMLKLLRRNADAERIMSLALVGRPSMANLDEFCRRLRHYFNNKSVGWGHPRLASAPAVQRMPTRWAPHAHARASASRHQIAVICRGLPPLLPLSRDAAAFAPPRTRPPAAPRRAAIQLFDPSTPSSKAGTYKSASNSGK